ncbi:hypothetical protein GF322_03620 [Candidatus Dependentiae bacterium]|nr:hypothetical protein [Candidatus Dependentiae bacterium]
MYPRILQIYGPLWINSYGLMITIGLGLFLYLTYNNPKRKQILPTDIFFNMIFIALIAGIVGGRIFFLFSEWHYFSQNPLEIFFPWIGGFAILGTIIGITITISIYLKLKNIKILPTLDLISLYAPLLQSISRIGCFLAGCCYGIPAKNLLWSITFIHPESLAPINIQLHPTQLYFSAASFIIFIILYAKEKLLSNKDGQLTFLYLILESISRFMLDFWRGDRDYIDKIKLLNNFSYTQLLALGIFILASIGYIITLNKKSKF